MATKPIKTNIRLEIVGADIVIEDADIELEIKKTNEAMPNYCTCIVYNMSDDTYNKIKSKAYYVNCYVDINGEGYKLIFAGDLRDLKKPKKPRKRKKSKHPRKAKSTSSIKAEPKYFEPPIRTEDDGPDIKTIIELQDGLKTIFLNFPYSISYKGSVSSNKILSDAISTLQSGNSAIGQYDTPNEFIYPNGFSYSGPIFNLVSKLCARGGCRSSIQNGVLSVIRLGGKNIDYIIELNSTNCPSPEEDTNKEINVDAPVLTTINPDNMIYLNFNKINGIKKVYKLKTKVDNYGGNNQGTKLVCKTI